MDRLTELFASKPTSYMGLGVVYNGDTRGNGVTSQEQDVVVIPRFNQSDGGGNFRGAWCPTVVGASTANLTGGTIFDGTTTWTPTVTGISLVAASFNYIYLHVELNPDTIDSYVTGGGLSSATVEAHSSTQTNSNTDAYILLCTIDLTNNNAITRYQWYSFGCQLRNSGVGDVVFNYW